MAATNAAILFEPASYDTARKDELLKGRHVAGASFLDGFVRYADVDEFVAITFTPQVADVFRKKIDTVQEMFGVAPRRPGRSMTLDQTAAIAAMGTFYCPDPTLPRFSWDRRFVGQRAYSFCGITHTVSSKGVMQSLADYLTAPLQSWDALICTSTAVRDVVRGVHEEYGAYLEARSGARLPQPVQLPVIPLGLDAETFVARGSDAAARKAMRERFGIGEDDVVALFLGRLAFHAKAHCSPMYAALQRAQEQLAGEGRQLHMLMTGQFPNQHAEVGYKKAATLICPDVPVHFVDGTPGPESWASWAAADMFLSLSDNIQESFGITPIEAMAAGLPCVVSDWDGYKDTIVEGETGFRIRSTMSIPGTGNTVARAFSSDRLTYDRYIGAASLITSVDIDETAEAIVRLTRDPALRRRMGEAGIARARSVYDWSAIIPQYQSLWAELGDRRRLDAEIAPPPAFAANPVLPDPMVSFRAYPTEHAAFKTRVEAVFKASRAEKIFDDGTATFIPELILPRSEAMALFERIEQASGASIGDLIADLDGASKYGAARTVMWFAKFGALRLLPAASRDTTAGKGGS
ncbi:MAG: glycosyltransferase family 4 protein [Thalassobaculaceae bacterium]|nr:glycosyltransferase family 4 protein [Thalassobaculaceae bacterium]